MAALTEAEGSCIAAAVSGGGGVNSLNLEIDENGFLKGAEPFVAEAAFEAQSPDELAFPEGQVLQVVEKCSDGWCMGVIDECIPLMRQGNPPVLGKTIGWFPANFVWPMFDATATAGTTITTDISTTTEYMNIGGPAGPLKESLVCSPYRVYNLAEKGEATCAVYTPLRQPFSDSEEEEEVKEEEEEEEEEGVGKINKVMRVKEGEIEADTMMTPAADGTSSTVIALWSCEAEAEDELTFVKGDLIQLVQKEESNAWWEGYLLRDGQSAITGLFPRNRVRNPTASEVNTLQLFGANNSTTIATATSTIRKRKVSRSRQTLPGEESRKKNHTKPRFFRPKLGKRAPKRGASMRMRKVGFLAKAGNLITLGGTKNR